MAPPQRRVYPIPADELRRRFNAQNFAARIRRGEIFTRVTKTWPADGSRNLPANTFTIMTEYVDGMGRFVAETHHYQQRGGSFRTEPDPKQLVLGNELYILEPDE